MLEEVLKERELTIEEMAFRHPWVPIFWNKLVNVMKVAVLLSLVWWAVTAYLAGRDTAAGEKAVENYVAAQEAAEDPNDEQIEAVLPVIAKLSTDEQKRTELGVFIARCMSGEFPDTLKENAEKPGQWPLYDGTDTTWDKHDQALAEEILRPYLEHGTIPLGLTKDMCWATWSPNDLVARNSYELKPSMETWRWQG